MIEIREVLLPEQKTAICNDVLRTLPNWFGCEESLVEYVAGVGDKPFYGVFDRNAPVGFAAVKVHNAHTAEIYVIGIKEAYHGQGIGKKLVAECEDFCRWHCMDFLTVKTLADTVDDVSYARTRGFYEAVGFRPLEVFPLHWHESSPCLFMAKHVKA